MVQVPSFEKPTILKNTKLTTSNNTEYSVIKNTEDISKRIKIGDKMPFNYEKLLNTFTDA